MPNKAVVKALFDFEAREEEELSFKAGETLDLIFQDDSGWAKGRNAKGVKGWFPFDYVQVVVDVNEPKPSSTPSPKSPPLPPKEPSNNSDPKESYPPAGVTSPPTSSGQKLNVRERISFFQLFQLCILISMPFSYQSLRKWDIKSFPRSFPLRRPT